MPHRVVVVGGGFGGLHAVKGLARAPVEVTLVDRRNFHLFQPLLYQVATGALSPGEIAMPLRAIFKRQRNVRVVLGEVARLDLDGRRVELGWTAAGDPLVLEYDSLVVAAGAHYSYFGHDEWRPLAPSLKSMEDALEIRGRILLAFEAAELERDPARRAAWLTFVVVGAGPTGVELAGQIAEIARDTLPRDFRSIDPRAARIVLVEGADRILTTFPPSLSAKAARSLERLGVTPLVGRLVVDVASDAVTTRAGDGSTETLATRTVVWAAGVAASGLGEALRAEVDRAGRVVVGADLTLPGRPEVFVIGDMAAPPEPLPGVAQVAMQGGAFAAQTIRARLAGRDTGTFRYLDKGNLATIGRASAVADIRGLRLSGRPAWLVWLVVHIFYLIGFQNRLLVLIRWTVSFWTHGRGARLITGSAEPETP